MSGVPHITVTGWSNSGKTTLLTQVVECLTAAGVSVGVVKHHGHRQEMVDAEGKDSWKYAMAGATPVVLSSSKQYAIFKSTPECEATCEELIAEIADEVDMVIIEGFRSEAEGAVEVFRVANDRDGRGPKLADEERIALVTDDEALAQHARTCGTPVFNLDDIEGVTAFFADYCGIALA